MDVILDSLGEAITIRDVEHGIIYANRAALEHLGFDSLEDLQRHSAQAIFDDYIVQDEHGAELTMDAIPSVRLIAGEAAEPLVIRTVHRRTGELRWQLLKAAMLHDERGELLATVTIIEDVTAEKRASVRERFLARATETLMLSIDYQETLSNVAWLVVPEIADWCAVDLVDESGAREQVVVAHRDPAKLPLAQELAGYEDDQLDPERGIGRVVRTGLTEMLSEIPDRLLVESARDDEHLVLLRALGFRSVLLVPLRARGRTFGVMSFVTAESQRRYGEDDRAFAEQLASRAAVAVDNARLATARREISETLQRSLLPDAVPDIPGWEIATMYRTAGPPDEVEVGGDFYDFFETPAGWLVLLGDVTGRGVEAATMTSLIRHGAAFIAKQESDPSRILSWLDQALRERDGVSLCSALCVRLEGDRVILSSAGHPPPLIVRDDGRIRQIGGAGPLLGGWEGSVWDDRTVRIAADETLLLYTDGVTDTRGEQERFGAGRLRRVLSEHAGIAPGALLAALEDELQRFQAEVDSDDTGAIALRPARIGTGVGGPPPGSAGEVAGGARG